MKVAVIGSGIAGLAAAHRLRAQASVTLFEAGTHFGGHANTVDVTLPDSQGQPLTYGVDTGFLVFNERTYPGLTALFRQLNVATSASDMSFSVQVPGAGVLGAAGLEWSGASLATVFAQRRNALRPRFLNMLRELLRFNRLCSELALAGDAHGMAQSLQDFLDQHGFGRAFRQWYLLPMLGSIWSCPTHQMLQFPVATMIRFCHNHGLIQLQDRPQWRTVTGGSRRYVNAMLPELDARRSTPVWRIERNPVGVLVHSQGHSEFFDAVVLAVHSDQALRLLAQPSELEAKLLGAIRYQRNRAVLHTDARVMPKRRAAWAAWNYERAADEGEEAAKVCLHYWLNRLQPLPFAQDVWVSLNPNRDIAPESVLRELSYDHPVFDLGAMAAQPQIDRIQGMQHTWFAGAWTGYGFHEDGLQSGYRAADALLSQMHRREAA